MARRRSRLQVLVIRAVVNCAGTNYVGNYYEATTGLFTKYYYAGNQRVAWRVNGTLYFGFSDHLSSTSITVDVNGTIVGNELYNAWGGERYTWGSINTTFKYTGQRQEEAGLYFYNARWYDPQIGRFIQPDSIIPDPGNPLAWDRYAYGYNNPVNSIDPSGHIACDANNGLEECRSITASDYIEALRSVYRWSVIGNWTSQAAGELIDTAAYIDHAISSVTNGNGRGWMYKNLRGATIINNDKSSRILSILDFFRKGPGTTPGFVPNRVNERNNIYINRTGQSRGTYIHELGHVADNNSNNVSSCAATWCGGGAADDLASFIGIDPSGIRWAHDISVDLPENYRWEYSVDQGYGNTTSSEYFAQAFKYTMMDQSQLPNSSVYNWMVLYFNR
jgi:RHS repeat-associated protein